MNKAGLIERIAAEAAVTKKQAEEMLEVTVDTIINELKVGITFFTFFDGEIAAVNTDNLFTFSNNCQS